MTEAAVLEVQRLRMEVARLVECLSLWLSTEEMCARYKCTPQTLRNMERRGDIPTRTNGRWNRSEVMQWKLQGNNHRFNTTKGKHEHTDAPRRHTR